MWKNGKITVVVFVVVVLTRRFLQILQNLQVFGKIHVAVLEFLKERYTREKCTLGFDIRLLLSVTNDTAENSILRNISRCLNNQLSGGMLLCCSEKNLF